MPGTCENERICVAGGCTYTPLPANTVCRPTAGDCDVAELCDGQRLDCPPDAFPSGVLCRDVAGDCDLPEFCPGDGPHCPADRFKDAGTVCRPADGPCNPQEICSGNSPQCPADTGAGGVCGDACCTLPERCVYGSSNAVQCGIGGGLGQPCLAPGGRDNLVACDGGLVCDVDTFTCVACGGNGELCCWGSQPMCDTPLVCDGLAVGSHCRPCGGEGEVCCSDLPGGAFGSCGPDLECSPTAAGPSFTCLACGGRNQRCCGLVNCDPGFFCSSLGGVCQECGGPDQRCCNNIGSTEFCQAGYTCVGFFDHAFCRACGGQGQPCCGANLEGGACGSGLTCALNRPLFETICVPPGGCGGLGEPCCLPGGCDAGLTCENDAGNLRCLP